MTAVQIERKRIVLIGGAGVFGQRLARLLSSEGSFALVIAGRDLTRARSFAATLTPAAEFAVLDRDALNVDTLRTLNPWAVVDASGPFLVHSFRPYAMAEAALDVGAHYVDIADGRDFVSGIGILDAVARRTNRAVISGASTTPALSSAVCDAMTRDMPHVHSLEIGITPGNRAPRGLAVIKSILGYAGRPVKVWREGKWGFAPGWGLLTRLELSRQVGRRWFSLCDAPDLELFPTRYSVRDRVVFRGGLELSVLHLGLTLASQLVRIGILPSLSPFAEMARDLADALVHLGTDEGGMIVDVTGVDAGGCPVQRRWSLVAKGGDGPNIPVLGAFAILQRLASDAPPPAGARACVGEITLAEFERLFQRFQITTQQVSATVEK